MNLMIKPMSLEEAEEISNWNYNEPYSIYSMDGGAEGVMELLDGSYYSAFNEYGELVGYFCYGHASRVPAGYDSNVYSRNDVVDIGLGMRPDLCGKGKGLAFLNLGLDFGKKSYDKEKFRLTVAAFNKRAVTVYERAGFRGESTFKKKDDASEVEFMVMIRE